MISHLFFANDSFLFVRATENEVGVLKDFLSIYERASGQAINMQKSEIFFSSNTPQAIRGSLANLLGVRI